MNTLKKWKTDAHMVQPTNMVRDAKFRVMPNYSKLRLKNTLYTYSINFRRHPTVSGYFSPEQDRFLIHLGNGEQLKISVSTGPGTQVPQLPPVQLTKS